MSVGAICNRQIPISAKTTSVAVAAKLMHVFGAHVLLVTDEKDGRLFAVGVLTEEDIVSGIVASEADPSALTVADIMSADYDTVREGGSVFDTIRLMYEKHLKHVAVLDELGGLVGIVTTDRLFESMAEELIDFSALVLDKRSRQRKHASH
ncbi:MAG: CBS domain-containing protein [Betaproteobacteria bacterium]|nr:CBS domain-containing protein [Betaproteobacteria bacterium]MBI3055794.1 CBS domain-containing protein [Betaproteobacteria bacterium]